MKGNMLGVHNLGKSKETSVTPNAWLNVQMYTHMHTQVLGVLTVIMQIEGKQVASENTLIWIPPFTLRVSLIVPFTVICSASGSELITKAFGCKTNVQHTCIHAYTYTPFAPVPSFFIQFSSPLCFAQPPSPPPSFLHSVIAFGCRKCRIIARHCFKCCHYKMGAEKP